MNTFVNNLNTEFESLTGNEQNLEAIEYSSQFYSHMLEASQTYIT